MSVNELIVQNVNGSIHDVKNGLKTKLEAKNYVLGYLLSALELESISIDEYKKYWDNFRSKVNGISNKKI